VTRASKSASFNKRTSVAAVNKPLHIFRARKRNGPTASCRPVSDESRRCVETQTHGQDMEAFQQMFVTSRPKFVAIAHAILRNREDAEDAVQNAFLSGYLHLRSFEGRSNLTTWFTRIVLNAALMVRRKRKPSWTEAHAEPLSADDTSWMEKIPAAQPDPEMMYAEEETLQLIDVLLGRMSPLLRQAFTMTYYQEMSNEEAGALLGVTTGTFKSRLFRARRHLINHASRLLLAPIRRAMDSPYPSRKSAFQALAPRSAESLSPEIAFS
jgi:RNA polymerase sigma-70 factor, ECF subfamily